MKSVLATAAMLAATMPAMPAAASEIRRPASSYADLKPKPSHRTSATPNNGTGKRIEKGRAKAKAALKARTAQRLRAKGKR